MAFTFNEALSKIGTAEYSGVDGLIRLVHESISAEGNVTVLLFQLL